MGPLNVPGASRSPCPQRENRAANALGAQATPDERLSESLSLQRQVKMRPVTLAYTPVIILSK